MSKARSDAPREPVSPQVRVEVTPTNDWRRLHLWHIQPIRDALLLIAIVALFWLGDRLSVVTVPMLLALLLSYLFEPLVRRITRTGRVSRNGAAVAIIALGALAVVLPVVFGTLFAGGQAIRLVQGATQNAQKVWESVTHWNDPARRDRIPTGLWLKARDSLVEERAWRRYESLLSAEARDALRSHAFDSPKVKFITADEARIAAWNVPKPIDLATQEIAPADFRIDHRIHNGLLDATDQRPTDATPSGKDNLPSYAKDLPASVEFVLIRPTDVVRTIPVLAESRTRVGTFFADAMSALDWSLRWLDQNQEALQKRALAGSSAAVGFAATTINSIVATFGGFIFGAFLTAFFFFFFCTGWGKVLDFWEDLIPERRRGRVIDLLSQMDRVIAGFVRGRLVICGILILLYTTGYLIVGVPAWLIVGPIVGILTLVPYAAGVFAPIAMLLMALDTSGPAWQNTWWWTILAPLLVLGAAQLLDDYVLTPKIQGHATGMDTPTIVFASIAGGALAGVYGLLIAIPFFACIKILLREVIWPRFRDWSEGRAADPLPIGHDALEPKEDPVP